jgi:hypothetical protein
VQEASNHSVLDKLGKKRSTNLDDDGGNESGTEEGSEDDEDYNGSGSSESDNESDIQSSGSDSDTPARAKKRKSETRKSKKVITLLLASRLWHIVLNMYVTIVYTLRYHSYIYVHRFRRSINKVSVSVTGKRTRVQKNNGSMP